MNLSAIRGDPEGDALAIVLALGLFACAMLFDRFQRRRPRV